MKRITFLLGDNDSDLSSDNSASSSAMASTFQLKINDAPPVWNSNKINYDAWKFEVELWNDMTMIAKNQRGRYVMLALPIDDPNGARDKIRLQGFYILKFSLNSP